MGFEEGAAALAPGGAIQAKQAPGDGEGGAASARLPKGRARSAIRYNKRRYKKKPEMWAQIEEAIGASVDGDVSSGDVEAVAKFQDGAGERVDGKVGGKTAGAIEEAAPGALADPTADAKEDKAAAEPAPKAASKEAGNETEAPADPPIVLAAAPPVTEQKAPAADLEAEAGVEADANPAKAAAGGGIKQRTAADHKAINRTTLTRKKDRKALGEAAKATLDADGNLTQVGVHKAAKAMRAAVKRWDPVWLMAVQSTLGAPTDGGFSVAFCKAIAANQLSRGVTKPDGRLDTHGTTEALSGLAGLDVKDAYMNVDAAVDKSENKKKKWSSSKTATALAVVNAGYADSWSAWVGQFRTVSFLGQDITGHAEMAKRLMVAERYLTAKEPGLDAAALGQKMGAAGRRSDFRPPKKRSSSMHGFGLAFDLGIADNPWILGQNAAKDKKTGKKDQRDQANKNTKKVIANACLFMGYGENLSLGKLHQMGQQLTTDELAERLTASNDALQSYRGMAKDPAKIKAHLENGASEAAKKKGLKYWLKTIPADHKRLKRKGHKSSTNWDGAGTKNSGFMSYKKELIVALRDIAGLAWGGCDLGFDSGDMMHFDMRSTQMGSSVQKLARKYKKSSKLDKHLGKKG
ncbi:MAG: hypothetical protein ACI9MR_000254 [Myxococcota bacterium]|jgi:hypothetical protein